MKKIQDCKDCKDVEDVRKIEGEWIRKIGTLNKQVAGRTQEQYNLDTQERRQEYLTQYTKNNTDRKKEYDKIRYENNKETKLEQNRQYREKHKEEINTRRSVKVECECGGRYTLSHKAEHMKTKHHQNYLNNNIDNVQIQESKCQDR